MKFPCIILLNSFMLILLFAQRGQDQSGRADPFKKTDRQNYPVTTWNRLIGISKSDLISSSDSPSSLNNFICDAMLDRTEADFSFINFGDITSSLYAGDITELDLYALCPFDRTLVVLEVNGAFLIELLETSISGFRPGLAAGGGKIEFDRERPNGNRLTYFQIGNYPVYPKKDYRLVTTDYLAAGKAGFSLLTNIDSAKVFKTGILLRDALQQYIEKHSPLEPASIRLDERWIKK
jgi:5'-nucleotidase/UDP-sugar diphosphatase